MTAPVDSETVGHVEMCASGATYRQIDMWTRQGRLRLAYLPGGSGTRREWLATEVPVAALMARLTSAGVLPEAAERVARGGELAPGLVVVEQQEPATDDDVGTRAEQDGSVR